MCPCGGARRSRRSSARARRSGSRRTARSSRGRCSTASTSPSRCRGRVRPSSRRRPASRPCRCASASRRARAPAGGAAAADRGRVASCSRARSTGCRSPAAGACAWRASRGRSRRSRGAAAVEPAHVAEALSYRMPGELPLVTGSGALRRRELPSALLAAIHDPPRRSTSGRSGEAALLARPAVAVVGARACSSYGRSVARSLARELAAAGLVVVSGMARGIDGEAHRGALEAGGTTVAVLGCGIDRDYPAAHAELARRICERGLVVSEYEPGIEPAPWRFPARNRIIAGLCAGDRRRRGARAERRADHRGLRARGGTRGARGSRRDHERAVRRHERAAPARRDAGDVRGRRARDVRDRAGGAGGDAISERRERRFCPSSA